MTEILTNADALRQISKPIPSETVSERGREIAYQLLHSIPEESIALGLAAPQIGIFERIFIAQLTTGFFVFINPRLSTSQVSRN